MEVALARGLHAERVLENAISQSDWISQELERAQRLAEPDSEKAVRELCDRECQLNREVIAACEAAHNANAAVDDIKE